MSKRENKIYEFSSRGVKSTVFGHFCEVCGEFAPFGFGVNMRSGKFGTWYCGAHLSEAAL